MTRSHKLDPVLRSLDPASDDGDPARARRDLRAILAVDPGTGLRTREIRRPRRVGRVGRVGRVVLFVGVAAAVTAGVVVLPAFRGGDRAFASWTAEPAGLSPARSADAADGCRDNLEDGAGSGDLDRLRRAQPAVAEHRGVWTTVVLAGDAGFSALCITDDSAGRFDDAMIGSVGTSAVVAPGPRDLVATDLGTGTLNAGELSLAAGWAGGDVVGLTYRSSAHGAVAATVDRGRFALWFPGDELKDTADGVEVEVTYRDGGTGTSRLSL